MKLVALVSLSLMMSYSILNASENKETPAPKDVENVSEVSELMNNGLDTQKLHRYLEKLQSYSANFQQQLVGSSRRLIETTSGEFVMQRPNKFRWQIFTPYEQSIIADGKSIWSVDNDLEQVTISDIDENIVNSPIMILSQNNNKLNEIFTVKELKNTNENTPAADPLIESTIERFLLKPIDNNSNFERVVLGFNDGILYLIELHDSLGQITIVTMTNIRNNPILGNNQFVYTEMPDFDVIDSRELKSDGQ